FDVTAGLALGRSVAGYVFQNFLLPRATPPSPAGPGSILFVTAHLTAEVAPGGPSVRVDPAGASLPVGKSAVSRVPLDASSTTVVSDTSTTEAFRTLAQGARAQTHVRNVNDVFASADPWEQRFVSAR